MRLQHFVVWIILCCCTQVSFAQENPIKRPDLPLLQYLTIQDYDQVVGQVDKQVSISGVCDEFKPSWAPKAPCVIYLRDPHHTIEVVYWESSMAGQMVEDFRKPGTPVYATGLAQVYRGKLQIKIQENKNLSTAPLPDFRLVDQQTVQPEEIPLNKKKIAWTPFDGVKATQSMNSTGCAIVYFRSEKSSLCEKLETQFLLTSKGQELSTDCMYFVNMDGEKGEELAREMDIKNCPVILVLKPYFQRKAFLYTEKTSDEEIELFLKEI